MLNVKKFHHYLCSYQDQLMLLLRRTYAQSWVCCVGDWNDLL